ncbi:putative Oxidoreductase, DsbA-like [Nitrospira defluvii]|jgi:protein-disulfide isomerase|uniref:Putative Oxidoreductase, DsbA-like n=1 Tax=Nitrospira defluvii TaxID=330214 RepID=D8PIW6_9BACT|nr:putative Oxidoreductase, DsbA-like [Nitrospira defluvii]
MNPGSDRLLLSLGFALAACTFLSPVEVRAAGPSGEPLTRQALEQMIEQYIRTHPEVIEQSLQSLENKRAAEEQERQKAALATHQQELLNDPASPVSGNPAGDVTVVEFFDYRCGYCKRAASALTQLQQSDARVRVVYKDFPILGETSELAAKAALASNLQGKHRAFHEALLATKDDLTKEQLFRIAAEAGVDVNRLDQDMTRPEWQPILDRNRALAKTLGISGTPAFIVGNDLVPGALDLKTLQELVAHKRKQ